MSILAGNKFVGKIKPKHDKGVIQSKNTEVKYDVVLPQNTTTSNTMCACNIGSKKSQVSCFLEKYKELNIRRGININFDFIPECIQHLKFSSIIVANSTHAMAECEILLTFLKGYTKTHPNFLDKIQDIGLINLKSSLFEST